MIRLPKSVLSFGAVALVTGVVTLAVPRAAHAVAAALVQVNNTAANPALTQDITLQSAQIVHLGTQGGVPPNLSLVVGVYSASGSFTNGYDVPANATLVITGVDITPLSSPSQTCPAATQISLATASSILKAWALSGPNTAHFEYPSGIPIAPGEGLLALNASSSACAANIDLHGYLTSN